MQEFFQCSFALSSFSSADFKKGRQKEESKETAVNSYGPRVKVNEVEKVLNVVPLHNARIFCVSSLSHLSSFLSIDFKKRKMKEESQETTVNVNEVEKVLNVVPLFDARIL